MNSKNRIVVIALACLCFFAPAAQAQEVGSLGDNFNGLVLTPGHSQTIMFELDNIIFNNNEAFHAALFLTLGEGRVTVRVGPASSVGDFAGMVFSVVGLIGLQPVIDYGYNAESISVSVDVPAFSVGILFTGVIVGIGSPDFPVVMSMVVSHL